MIRAYYPLFALDAAFPTKVEKRGVALPKLVRGDHRWTAGVEGVPTGRYARVALTWLCTVVVARDEKAVDPVTGRVNPRRVFAFMREVCEEGHGMGGNQRRMLRLALRQLLGCSFGTKRGGEWHEVRVAEPSDDGHLCLTGEFMDMLRENVVLDWTEVVRIGFPLDFDAYAMSMRDEDGVTESWEDLMGKTGQSGTKSQMRRTWRGIIERLSARGILQGLADSASIILAPAKESFAKLRGAVEQAWERVFPARGVRHAMPGARLYEGDAEQVLRTFPESSVDCVVTSPPYFDERNYGCGKLEVGHENTLGEYVQRLLRAFREVRRILSDDGTCWVNVGDRYLKDRDGSSLANIPALLGEALKHDGWFLRNDIIWEKTRSIPDSASNRCANRMEHILFLTKTARYVYNLDAVRVPLAPSSVKRLAADIENEAGSARANDGRNVMKAVGNPAKGRNQLSIWRFCPSNDRQAHLAMFPPELPGKAIVTGCKKHGVVLDPFNGSGTTGVAAKALGMKYVGIDLSGEYLDMAEKKIATQYWDPANLERVEC
ncbi:DNA-methyltransferase [Bifidobacterium olomucense]|uniref:site-specific DNA-methyltransferase (cytosine-N(4)-specific) n=1 Tax=Bifidobacterium olomucense TaxID=2675324 RepID=A0A7Y0EY60_9BIFI|nr:site-specific DNA-methyltransferase [Bifidobacterium sp. DSM 109959]NMM97496.1 DNA methylase [Bifidobacterium sp. DSM 109959]